MLWENGKVKMADLILQALSGAKMGSLSINKLLVN